MWRVAVRRNRARRMRWHDRLPGELPRRRNLQSCLRRRSLLPAARARADCAKPVPAYLSAMSSRVQVRGRPRRAHRLLCRKSLMPNRHPLLCRRTFVPSGSTGNGFMPPNSSPAAMHAKDRGAGVRRVAVRRSRFGWMWRHDRLPVELSHRRGLQSYRDQILLHTTCRRENPAEPMPVFYHPGRLCRLQPVGKCAVLSVQGRALEGGLGAPTQRVFDTGRSLT